jgi:hypothetical protein
MKLLAMICLPLFLSICGLAQAHNGYVERVPSVVVEVNQEGGLDARVKNSLLSKEELHISNALRQHLGIKFGEKAVSWPFMLLLKQNKAMVLNEDSGEYFNVDFAALHE